MRGNDRTRRPTLSLGTRGQTTQDFAIGIGIFILATAFVFTFVPSIITPFADSGGANSAQAERIANTIVGDLSTDDKLNQLDESRFYDEEDSSEDLASDLGLRSTSNSAVDRVNITIETIGEDPEIVKSTGHNFDGQTGASTTRIVTLDSGDDCDPACRLIVRVW